MRTQTLLLALLTLLLGGCNISFSHVYSKDGFLLREVEGDDGSKVSYRLYSGGGEPKLHRTEMSISEVPSLGIRTRTIKAGSSAAKRYGINAFDGVLVDFVHSDSAASHAGLRIGDVIRRVGTTQISSSDQLQYIVQTNLTAGTEVEIELLRPVAGGSDAPSPGAPLIQLTPDSKRVEVSKTDVLPLEHSKSVYRLTGMQIAGLDAEMAAQIFDQHEAVVLIASVIPGSPAYHAGLRRGDRILRCDNREVHAVADVRSVVRDRAAKQNIDLDDGEELSVASATSDAAALETDQAAAPDAPIEEGAKRKSASPSAAIRFEVSGPLGLHTADVRISDELDEVFDFDIPILVEYNSDVDSTRSSFLDFIFQFGWNYRSQYLQSSTREVKKKSYFSLFPFGMFEFVRTPTRSENTFLWFITFDSRR